MFKCENCGEEHDGSYGSGRFCSANCRLQYCGKCGTDKLLTRKSTKGISQNHIKQRKPYGTWKCEYCNDHPIFETRRKLEEHKREFHPIPKGSSWSKGLTKQTDDRVKRNAESVSKTFKKRIADGYVNPTWTAEYWTEERRKEQSERKKQLYALHPEKHPNRKLAGNRKQMTYPEKLTYDWLIEHNIKFEHQKEFCFDGVKRFVDFYIPSRKMFIEIDGEYWHPEDNDSDKQKDELAIKYGFITVRLRPKKIIVKQLEKIFN